MTQSSTQAPAGSVAGTARSAEAAEGQASLRASEQRFRHLVETVNVVPYTWDIETHRYIYVGPQAARIIGYPPERWTSESFWLSIMHPDDREAALQHSQGFNVRPQDEYFEYRVVAADGRVVWIRDIIKVDSDATGRRVGYGMMFDITEAKQREVLLQQAQKMEAIGQLTGGIAHDFNNLLTVIVGNIELVADRLPEELRKRLDHALQAADRGARLVDHLLAFSRRLPLRPERLDLSQVAAGMAELLRRTLGEDIAVDMKLHPLPWSVFSDRGQIESALLNLAINARDAMPEPGRLTIETGNLTLDAQEAAQIEDLAPGDYATLTVIDTGTGMPPEVLARAVEPFFTTKDVGKGSGLGLSMIYGFAKQSRGHLKIHSAVGEGTVVRLYLPRLMTQQPAAGAERPALAEPPRGTEAILVVEDEPLVRDFVVSQLRGLGYRVIEATDGPHARALLDSGAAVDLLFTDVVMPGGMSGRQLATEATRRRPGLRTLYSSGYTKDAIVHLGKLESGVHFLSKPYRRHELALKVRAALDAPAQGA